MGDFFSKRAIGVFAGFLALLAASVIWWQQQEDIPANSGDSLTEAEVVRRKQRPAGGRSLESGKTTGIARTTERSANRQVRELSDKLAKEFEQDPSILATRLADEENKHLAYDIGRDLIAMFPDKAKELMAGFRATRPPELASYLCGSLVESVAARGRSDEALALADGLEPGRNRLFAFTALVNSLNPRDYGKILVKVRADGFPEDAKRLELGLVSRAANFPVKELENLMTLEVSREASDAVCSAYGNNLVAEKGRTSALQIARSLPVDRQAGALYGVLNRGAAEEDGSSWLLETLGAIDSNIKIDRASLTIGVAQQMLKQSSSSAMEWVLSIPDSALRDATVSGAMHSWLQMNSMEASEWLGKQPASSAKDAAISDVAKFLSSRGDLGAARSWLAEMQDSRRKQALEKDIEVLAQGAPR